MYRCWKKRQWWLMTGPSSWHGSALDFLWSQVHCSSVLLRAYTQSVRQRKRRMCSTLCQVCTTVGFATFQGDKSMMLHISYCYTIILNIPDMESRLNENIRFIIHLLSCKKIIKSVFLWRGKHLMIFWCHKCIPER